MSRELRDEATLVDLYHLDQHDIDRFILSEGRIGFDAALPCFYVYLPSLGEYVNYPWHLHAKLLAKLQRTRYSLDLEDTVLSVDSPAQPPSGFLLLPDFEQRLMTEMDITAETFVLVSSRINVPIFFGKDTTIKRLAEDFDGVSGVMAVHDLLQWKVAHV